MQSRSLICLLLAVGSTILSAQGPTAANLVQNSGFEQQVQNWAPINGTAQVVSYNTPNYPSSDVAAQIGGGGLMLRDQTRGDVVEQLIALSSTAATSFRAGAYLGGIGESPDYVRMSLRWLDASMNEIDRSVLPIVQDDERNGETVLVLRQGIYTPAGNPAFVAIQIAFVEVSGSSVQEGLIDNVFFEPYFGSLTPAPKPMGTNLITNGDFEGGWTGGSPLLLNSVQSWIGVGSGRYRTCSYGSISCNLLPTNLATTIAGGQNLLRHTGYHSVATLRQRIDLRGNTPQLSPCGSMELLVTAYLGGLNTSPDDAEVFVRFLDLNENPLFCTPSNPGSIRRVTSTTRNFESLLLRRELAFRIPTNTAYAEIDVVAYERSGSTQQDAMVDNLSAILRPSTAPPKMPLRTELLKNGGSESASFPNSPLQVNEATSWFGSGTRCCGRVTMQSYIPGGCPDSTLAASASLGATAFSHTSGSAELTQIIDLTGHETAISSGTLRARFSAWLGGTASSPDNARVQVTFLDPFLNQQGLLEQLGPVDQNQRNNQCGLLPREGDVVVPPGSRFIRFKLIMTEVSGSNSGDALADGLSLVIYDALLGGPSLFPGTGDDLRLSSSSNSSPLTSGPGSDVITVDPGDYLHFMVASPMANFDGAPLLFALEAFTSSLGYPNSTFASIPGLHVDPNRAFFFSNGICAGPGGLFCASVAPLPMGWRTTFQIPPASSNTSVRAQAFVLHQGAYPALNGIFAGSDAHEVRIR